MRPQLLLNSPSELTLFYTHNKTTSNSILSGQVRCTNMSALGASSIDIHISLLRLGTFKKETRAVDTQDRRSPILNLFYRSVPHVKKNLDIDKADKILEKRITLQLQPAGAGNAASQRFELIVPSDLPPTASFPNFEISYALTATSTLPWGQVLRTSQPIRVSRRPVDPVPIQPTPTAYSNAPLSLCVSFDEPDPRSNELSAVLRLCSQGTDARLVGSLEWEVEEIATITTPDPAIPMSKSLRVIDEGVCVYSQSLAQPAGSQQAVDVPFTITIPNDTEFPNSVRADSCVLEAWSPKHARCEKMGFEVELEQVLRIRLHLDQYTKGKGNGAQAVYSVVLPLEGLWESKGANEGNPGHGRKYCITREAE